MRELLIGFIIGLIVHDMLKHLILRFKNGQWA